MIGIQKTTSNRHGSFTSISFFIFFFSFYIFHRPSASDVNFYRTRPNGSAVVQNVRRTYRSTVIEQYYDLRYRGGRDNNFYFNRYEFIYVQIFINHRKIDSNRHKNNSPNDRTSAKKTKQEVRKVLSLKKDLLV